MPLPPPRKKQKRVSGSRKQEVHPYIIKLNIKIGKLNKVLEQIYETANSDLVITDAASGNWILK